MKELGAKGETHFKVTIVSDKFDKMPLIERHRAVNECLSEELEGGVHALSIQAKTPEQWAKVEEAKKVWGALIKERLN